MALAPRSRAGSRAESARSAKSSTLDKMRDFFTSKSDTEQEYRSLVEDADTDAEADETDGMLHGGVRTEESEQPFSWYEYAIFVLLGIAMLWAWNMFLAAAPYFQSRFADNDRILANFQAAITSVATVTNLASMLILSNMQAKADYPKRIILSLIINIIVFALLAISTSYFRDISTSGYFVFTLMMVFITSVGTGLCQNGAFAFAAGFGRSEYLQALMTGQAIAGVLPSLASIITVLAVPESDPYAAPGTESDIPIQENTTSAFIYFLTATVISAASFIAIIPLVRKHKLMGESRRLATETSLDDANTGRKSVSMWTLYKKLHWLAASVFICFTVSMFFPVFTQKVVSVVPSDRAPRLLKPNAFIPLGFLMWNIGDLTGRLTTLIPKLNPRFVRHPPILLIFAFLRAGFIPLYLLCNIEDHGAAIQSDVFYLFVVQLLFGLTNGWLGSTSMMEFAKYVDEGEREAAGGFMAVNLVAGLMAGSLLSFSVNGVH